MSGGYVGSSYGSRGGCHSLRHWFPHTARDPVHVHMIDGGDVIGRVTSHCDDHVTLDVDERGSISIAYAAMAYVHYPFADATNGKSGVLSPFCERHGCAEEAKRYARSVAGDKVKR